MNKKYNKHIVQNIVISIVTSLITIGAVYAFFSDRVPALTQTNIEQSKASTVVHDETIPDIVEASIPAVVSIVVTADIPLIERYYEDIESPFGTFFGNGFSFSVPRQRQIGTERQEIGGGTGFFVSPDGYLITNRHVVDREDVDYSVVTNDGESYDVEVIAKDPTLDVAVLKVDADSHFSYLTFADINDLRIGEEVIAIGNALAEFPNSVSAGIVSGLSRNIIAGDGYRFRESLEGVIQTDAAINRGNSGGPLLNRKGDVIGVNIAVAGGSENIGFALPADVVRSVYESVAEHGEIVRPFLGIRYLEITDEIVSRNTLPVDYGVIIVRGETRSDLAIIPGSPADKAGLEENDIILKINGEKLDGKQSLASIIRTFDVGETITLTILHDGEEAEVQVKLDKAE